MYWRRAAAGSWRIADRGRDISADRSGKAGRFSAGLFLDLLLLAIVVGRDEVR